MADPEQTQEIEITVQEAVDAVDALAEQTNVVCDELEAILAESE